MDWNQVRSYWDRYGFEIVVGITVLFIVVFGLYNRWKKRRGTYNRGLPVLSSLPSLPKKTIPKTSRGEIECKRVLEKIFNVPFRKERPDFLRNPITENNNLELDCVNMDLKLACEYNGIQHYKFSPFFHGNKDAFQNQKYRDYLKQDFCRKNGIDLIVVPYTVKLENIESYIETELKKIGRI